MWKRIKALIIKETFAVLRDPRNRVALIAPPLLQLFLFSFTGTQDVKNIHLAILNQDSGQPSSELVQRLSASPNFTDVSFVQSREQLRELIDDQRAMLAGRFGFLALQVHAAHGGEKLEIMFPPSCEQAVSKGMECVLVPANSTSNF